MMKETDAPKRIWATEDSENFGEDRFHSRRPFSGGTEYIRSDLHAELMRAADELATLLEARVIGEDLEYHIERAEALAAYNKAKENLK